MGPAARVYGREVENLPGEDQVGVGELPAAGKRFAGVEVEDRLPAVQAVLLGDVGEGVAGSHRHLRGGCSGLGKGGVGREDQEPAGADQPRVGEDRAVGLRAGRG